MTLRQRIKAHRLKNSESHIRDNTTSDFRSNRELTDDDRGYEVINAKDFHKGTEFNQFETLRDQHIINRSDNSPLSSSKFSSQVKEKSVEKPNTIPKHPTTQK